jgi:hypothetical protein
MSLLHIGVAKIRLIMILRFEMAKIRFVAISCSRVLVEVKALNLLRGIYFNAFCRSVVADSLSSIINCF